MARLEQLYVENAGLVIPWPFLRRFFQRVELIDHEDRFVDERASMQAIALLEYLATEDPDPPEHGLALAKLLCGQPPEARFVLPEPLAPELLAEAEHLLRAVVGHVPALRDMSSAGFRTSFLRRAGSITTHQGGWVLRVDRRPHDIVLERFGWSWGWVKLPWMPDPLRVEW